MHVLRASSQLILVWGSAACHSSQMAVTYSLVARTTGTSQMEHRSEGKAETEMWPSALVPPSVFHIAEAVTHGDVQGPKRAAVPSAVAPHRRRWERCALEALHTLAEVLPAVSCSLALSQQGR